MSQSSVVSWMSALENACLSSWSSPYMTAQVGLVRSAICILQLLNHRHKTCPAMGGSPRPGSCSRLLRSARRHATAAECDAPAASGKARCRMSCLLTARPPPAHKGQSLTAIASAIHIRQAAYQKWRLTWSRQSKSTAARRLRTFWALRNMLLRVVHAMMLAKGNGAASSTCRIAT